MHLSRVRKLKVMLSVTFSCCLNGEIIKNMTSVGVHAQSLRLLQLGSYSPRHLFQCPEDFSVLLQAVQLWQSVLNRLEIPRRALK